jgi:hypothetical protein
LNPAVLAYPFVALSDEQAPGFRILTDYALDA